MVFALRAGEFFPALPARTRSVWSDGSRSHECDADWFGHECHPAPPDPDARSSNACKCAINSDFTNMQFVRPKGILSGFSWSCPQGGIWPVLELGEQWVPGGRFIGEHHNTGWEVFYQPAGRSRWRCGRRAFEVAPGGFYLIAPGVRHRLAEFPDAEAHFYYAVLPEHEMPDWPRPFAHGGGAFALETPFRGLIRELTLDGPDRRQGLACYASALCLEVTRLLGRTQTPAAEVRKHPAVALACELFENRPAERWRLDEVAAVCGVSVPHLIALFRRDLGQTPRQYLLRRRIERADEILRSTDRPITELAYELGFSSSQHFAAAFRSVRGFPASAVRRKNSR
jgi:AraC-like DNA-binding protein